MVIQSQSFMPAEDRRRNYIVNSLLSLVIIVSLAGSSVLVNF